MNNDMWGAFFAGIGFTALIAGIFQIGLNVGLRISINLLEGNYPAAMQYLNKNKKTANVLPYVINGVEK